MGILMGHAFTDDPTILIYKFIFTFGKILIAENCVCIATQCM